MTGIPAVDAYEESKAKVERLNHQVWRLIAVFAIAALFLVSGALAYVTYEVGSIGGTVSTIRSSQVTNTRTSTHRSNCQETAFADAVADLELFATAPPGTPGSALRSELKIPPTQC